MRSESTVKEKGGKYLINSLSNKIGRESVLEGLFVLERVVLLSVWHAASIYELLQRDNGRRKGIYLPLSNQQSKTSSTLRKTFPDVGEVMVM